MPKANPQPKTKPRKKRMPCKGDAWTPDRIRVRRPGDNEQIIVGKPEEGCNGCGRAVGHVDAKGVRGKCEKIKVPEVPA